MAAGDPAGPWLVGLGAALAVLTSFGLRTRIPAPAVTALLAAGGGAVGWGGMLLQPAPPVSQSVFAVVALAVFVPFHVRVVVGPFGPRRASRARRPMSQRFQILEHTADVGLRALAQTAEELFEALGEGLATLQGAWFPGEGTERRVIVEAPDREALLAAWLDELLYLQESEDAVFASIAVDLVGDTRLEARVMLAPRGDRSLEGVGVKAATYHRLEVGREPDGAWVARVYLDV
jgi:SHS2 domain-containing protein